MGPLLGRALMMRGRLPARRAQPAQQATPPRQARANDVHRMRARVPSQARRRADVQQPLSASAAPQAPALGGVG
jgi:hypothetical protein